VNNKSDYCYNNNVYYFHERVGSIGLGKRKQNMSNTPKDINERKIDKLSEAKIKRDGSFQLGHEIRNKLEPDLSILSKKENTKMADKKIVNNKTSQFKPMMGVDFHMIKK